MNRTGGFWNEETVAELLELAARHLSASQIGAAMGTSRNSVIGKCYRDGIKLAGEPINGSFKSGDAPRRRAPRINPKPPKVERVFFGHANDQDVVRVASVVDLEPHHCKYPIGDPLVGFCGSKRVMGLPYCESHCARCYRPMEAGSRVVTPPHQYTVVAFPGVRAGTDVKEDA